MNGKPEEINNDWYHDQTQYSGHKVFTNLKLKKRKTYYIKYAVRKALLWILIQQIMSKFDLWFPFALRQWVFQKGNNTGCPWLTTRRAPPNNNVKILENMAIKVAFRIIVDSCSIETQDKHIRVHLLFSVGRVFLILNNWFLRNQVLRTESVYHVTISSFLWQNWRNGNFKKVSCYLQHACC